MLKMLTIQNYFAAVALIFLYTEGSWEKKKIYEKFFSFEKVEMFFSIENCQVIDILVWSNVTECNSWDKIGRSSNNLCLGSGDFMQRTDWHRVCVFKPYLRDSVYNYLKKGQRVLVNGRLSYGEIKDEEGVARPTTAIIADEVIFFQHQGWVKAKFDERKE